MAPWYLAAPEAGTALQWKRSELQFRRPLHNITHWRNAQFGASRNLIGWVESKRIQFLPDSWKQVPSMRIKLRGTRMPSRRRLNEADA
jgi:hypothetical protein